MPDSSRTEVETILLACANVEDTVERRYILDSVDDNGGANELAGWHDTGGSGENRFSSPEEGLTMDQLECTDPTRNNFR